MQVRQDLPRPLVSVAGELDVASVGLLAAMLDYVRRSVDRHGRATVALDDIDVDLTGVTFADSHGLAPLLDSPARIVGASGAVRRVLVLLRQEPLPDPAPPAAGAARAVVGVGEMSRAVAGPRG